jgi:hypothetical protein
VFDDFKNDIVREHARRLTVNVYKLPATQVITVNGRSDQQQPTQLNDFAIPATLRNLEVNPSLAYKTDITGSHLLYVWTTSLMPYILSFIRFVST